MILQGKTLNQNDKVKFRVIHNYDKDTKVGTLQGSVNFKTANTHVDIRAYYKNITHSQITDTTPLEELEFFLFLTDEGMIAVAEPWLVPMTVEKISNNFKDIRIYNVENDEALAIIRENLKLLGHPIMVIR